MPDLCDRGRGSRRCGKPGSLTAGVDSASPGPGFPAPVLSVQRGEEPPPTQSIEQTPPRSIQLILAEWRDAEKRAGEAEPGSPEAVELERVIDLLRDEYLRAHEAASGANPGG